MCRNKVIRRVIKYRVHIAPAHAGWGAVSRRTFGLDKVDTIGDVLAGLCRDAEKAQRDGPLWAGEVFCSCSECRVFNFYHCKLKSAVGSKKKVETKRAPTASRPVTQSVALEQWADSLEASWPTCCRASA